VTLGTLLKCDHQLPTGSFKDRGAEILLAFAAANGVREVVVDSSGNSASAAAAHAAKRGMAASIYAPSGGPLPKLAQIERYGATLHLVTGPREEVRAQALERTETQGAFYASHVENPLFHHGTKLMAYELVEQLGHAPDAVYVAVGNGSLLLGIALGFRELVRGGWITTTPRLIGVQTCGYAALVGEVDEAAPLPLADGIAVRHPRRLTQIQEAIARVGGETVVVDAPEIVEAQEDLAHKGVWVEPTGAVAFAARRAHRDRDDLAVCVGSGGGFKAP
jgi:threonine synthase